MKRMFPVQFARLATACALALASTLPAHADTVTQIAQLQGWVNSNGGSNEAIPFGNTYTGNEFGLRFNSWAAFFIPAGTTWASATLSLSPSAYGDAPPSVIALFDVDGGLEPFLNTFHPGTEVYDDLGSGMQYGAATLYDSPASITLNGAALAGINGASGAYFVIGFTNQTLNGVPADTVDGGIYLGGIGSEPYLELTLSTVPAVPEPGTHAMLLAGLAVAGAAARRRS
jgi:PEP-CTERM motif